jgi:hypothetical protein
MAELPPGVRFEADAHWREACARRAGNQLLLDCRQRSPHLV